MNGSEEKTVYVIGKANLRCSALGLAAGCALAVLLRVLVGCVTEEACGLFFGGIVLIVTGFCFVRALALHSAAADAAAAD